MGQGSEAIVLG